MIKIEPTELFNRNSLHPRTHQVNYCESFYLNELVGIKTYSSIINLENIMKKTTILAMIILSLCILVGCSNKSINLNPDPTKAVVKAAPDWYSNPNEFIPEGYIGTRATETSRDMMVADEKAQNAARGALRLQIEDVGETGNRRFVEETGLDAESEIVKRFTGGNESASAAALRGSKVLKSETHVEKDIYRAYILMIVPDPDLELFRQLEEDKALMEKFKETDYFNDLSVKIEKYMKRHKE